ncbi:MAG: ABC transporter permease [Eubacteriales bacterium]|nr:ABC transporter permease [Eubacteriales bacterium]
MKNNNQKVVKKLSNRSLRKNKMRNIFAVAAIALTCMLFTVLASMGTGMVQVTQEQTMREVGTKLHAGLKGVTAEQMEKITADPRVKDFSWNIYIGSAENILKRSGEIRYAQDSKELENSFVELKEGSLPKNEDDLIVDTFVLDELKLPYKLGVQVPLSFSFHGEQIEKTFTVCGWYEGDSVSHATQIYVSKAYWEKLKGNLTDRDFQDWIRKSPQDSRVGLYSVALMFDNERKIEEKVTDIIRDAGYEPDVDVEYGVNWAYLGNRAEQADPSAVLMLGAALAVILLTGYLIIYNIFQISILQDIRFYGLLKTVGTTKRQLKWLVRRQAFLLSLAGIPVGLAAGFLLGKALFPFAMSILDNGGMKIVLHFHPAILIFGAVFSLITVGISCRKPGRIAGSVSPIEAIRYNEGTIKGKKAKKSEKGAKVHKMALANLGRNKKKTVLVILSMSLSIILLCVVLTGVGSFRIEKYLESRLAGDVSVGSLNYTSNARNGDFQVDEKFLEVLDGQPGVRSKAEMWTIFNGIPLVMDEPARERYRALYEQGSLNISEHDQDNLSKALEKGEIQVNRYVYDTTLLKNLKVISGKIDTEEFEKGGYVLVTSMQNGEYFLYEPGDKITLDLPTPLTEMEVINDEEGNVVDIRYDNLESKEYEVMAVVDIPYCMDIHMYIINSVELVLPLSDVKKFPDSSSCFAVSYELEDGAKKSFKEAAKAYTENENIYMGYITKEDLVNEFSGMNSIIRTLGVALSAVIAFIGILNFINSMLTGIYARKRELAVLCSIGMTEKQLKRMLLEESLYYVLISGGVSIILGSVMSYGILRALNEVVLFFQYRYNGWAFVIMLPIFVLVAWVVPNVAYRRTRKESIVERLRETEN